MLRQSLMVCLAAASLSCGLSVDPLDENPFPRLDSAEPAVFVVGSPATDVVLRGGDFVDGAVVTWEGAARPTAFLSDSILEFRVDAADLSRAGPGEVVVKNPEPGGGESDPFVATVVYTTAELNSISPTEAVALDGTALALHVFGSGFLEGEGGSQVTWQGTSLATQFLSEGELIGTVPEHLLREGTVAQISVRNNAPGGGAGASLPFTLNNPSPILTTLEPDTMLVFDGTSFSIMGSGFTLKTTVSYNGVVVPTTSVTPTELLTAEIPDALVQRGQARLRIDTPPPGGGTATVDLFVRERTPTVQSTTPGTLLIGGEGTVVTVSGSSWAPDATVTVGGVARPLTRLSGSSGEITVFPEDLLEVGPLNIRVFNPRGGGDSNTFQFPVAPLGRTFVYSASTFIDEYYADLDGGNETPPPGYFGGLFPWDERSSDRAAVSAGPVCTENGCRDRLFLGSPTQAHSRVTDFDDSSIVLDEGTPRFSSDGSWIYFEASIQGEGVEIWRVRPDGTEAGPIAPAPRPDRDLRVPAPSNGGGRVAYSVFGPGAVTPLHAEILDLTTFDIVRIDIGASLIRWTSDDQRLVYLNLFGILKEVGVDGTGDREISPRDPVAAPGGLGRNFKHLSILAPDDRFVITSSGGVFLVMLDTGEIMRLTGIRLGLDRATWFGN